MDKKGFFQSKTIWVSLALTILGALEAFDWIQVVPTEYTGLVVGAIGILMMILRKVTTKAI